MKTILKYIVLVTAAVFSFFLYAAQGPVSTMSDLLRQDEGKKSQFKKPEKISSVTKLKRMISKQKDIEKQRIKAVQKAQKELSRNITNALSGPKKVKDTIDTIKNRIAETIESYAETFIKFPDEKKWVGIKNGYVFAIYEQIHDEQGNLMDMYTFNIAYSTDFGKEAQQQIETGAENAQSYDVLMYSPDHKTASLYSYSNITYTDIGSNQLPYSWRLTTKTTDTESQKGHNDYTRPGAEYSGVSSIIDSIKSEDTYTETHNRISTDYYSIQDERSKPPAEDTAGFVYGEEKGYTEEVTSNDKDYTAKDTVSGIEYFVREKTAGEKEDTAYDRPEVPHHIQGENDKEASAGFEKAVLLAEKEVEETGLGNITTKSYYYDYAYYSSNLTKSYKYTKKTGGYCIRQGTMEITGYDTNGYITGSVDTHTENGIRYKEETVIHSRDNKGRIESQTITLTNYTDGTTTKTDYSGYIYDTATWQARSYNKTVSFTDKEGVTTVTDYRITDIQYYANGLEKSLTELNTTENINTLASYTYTYAGRLEEEIRRSLNLNTNEYTYEINRYRYDSANRISERDRIELAAGIRTDYYDYHSVVDSILDKLSYTGGDTYTSYSFTSAELSQWNLSSASSLSIYKIRLYEYNNISELTGANYTSPAGSQGALTQYDKIKRTLTITGGTVTGDTIEVTLYRQ